MIKRALISVFNKSGVVEFAQGLAALGVEIISTGGTYKKLKESGVPVVEVAEYAGFPEMLDGRVKTLQPQIHAGILAIRDSAEHMAQLAQHGIGTIDLVAVNLYPFRETVAKPDVTLADAIENIDIGGPTMVRAAAKNHAGVAIVVDPARYPQLLAELQERGEVSPATRFELAVEAYKHTADYDAAVSGWLDTTGRALRGGTAAAEPFPPSVSLQLTKVQDLRYGENPHQRGAFYSDGSAETCTLARAKQLHGKELSFNNINDAHGALELVKEFDRPTAVAVKHTNPCGVAEADTIAEAYRKAYEADTVSIFGGIIALNRPCDADTARQISKIFVEIVLAPSFTSEAFAILSKKKDIRLLEMGEIRRGAPGGHDVKRVSGGYLVQDWDTPAEDAATWKTVTEKTITPEQLRDLSFAWKVCKHVKSNSIVVAKDGATLGVGAGQMNRIDAARHALRQAGEAAKGAVLASDAFFPFPDVVEAAAGAGIAVIAQPGGSIRDNESIARADQTGLAMLFTGIRHFKH